MSPTDKTIGASFLCPFCPSVRPPGTVTVTSDYIVSHSEPTCRRFDGIDEDDPESFIAFVRDAREIMVREAPS